MTKSDIFMADGNDIVKHDISQRSDRELSLIVFNDKYLYRQRRRASFLNLVAELFIYTEDQLQELKTDLAEDEKEENVK